MKLDYFTQLSPDPIKLSIGSIRKPRLSDISRISFSKFSYFEFFAKATPELYYTKVKGKQEAEYWNSLSDEEKSKITMYKLLLQDELLQKIYLELFNFFFIEHVVYNDGFFILLIDEAKGISNISKENIRGIIHETVFPQVLDLIQQICCIHNSTEDITEQKFKNNLAKKMFEKMLKAKQKERETKKEDIDLSLPNIISAISCKHPSINLTNVWDLTIFQLLDQFNRLQVNLMFDISCKRVATWGDEKKTFNADLWYKNEYDKK